MIDVKSLQYGNLIKWALEDEYALVEGYLKEDGEWIIYYHNLSDGLRNYARAEFFEPIPLSEELLVRSGFEKFSNIVFEITYNVGYKFMIGYAVDGYYQLYIKSIGRIGNHFNSFHQLQNLYSELTGKELPIKK